ncbi:hypothetical protein E3A20_24960, partial [Planctomyces bekefii]
QRFGLNIVILAGVLYVVGDVGSYGRRCMGIFRG